MWQDYVFALGMLFFCYLGLMMLLDRRTVVAWKVSVAAAIIQAVFAYTDWTLDLRLTAVLAGVDSLLFTLVALYRNELRVNSG